MWDLYKKREGLYFGKSQVLRDLPVPTKKAFARHERGSRCLRLERERDSWGAAQHRCWQEESCGWPAQGDLCGAALRSCASALLTHSGAGEDLPAGHWKIPGKCCLVRQGMSALSCVFALLSPACSSWEGRTPKASEGGKITFEKRICQFFSQKDPLC